MEKLEHCAFLRECKMVHHCGKYHEVSPKKLDLGLAYDPVVLLLGI